ncbi:MAG: ABC transporter substrate binding protein [Motiliproteus sp.]
MSKCCLIYYSRLHLLPSVHWLAGVLLLLMAIPATADPKNILAIVSKDSPSYQNVVRTLELHLRKTPELALQTIYLPELPGTESIQQADLIVTIGTLATRRALKLVTDKPILSTFIPRRTFQTLVDRDDALKNRQRQGLLSALYLEQPFQRQLKLLSLIKPDIKVLGTIIGPVSKDELGPLEQAIAQYHWDLHLEQLDENDNPIQKLTPLVASSDAFLAVPDKSVFNRSTAKWILLMTFRQRIPLIAYSKRYVDAGAVAAVFSTPQTVGEETAQLIQQWQAAKKQSLPASTYPLLFDLSVNQGTARSLRLKLPSLDELHQRLEER